MTYSPETYKAIRAVFQRETGLPPVALGIQHYSPEGGGYHEGNDLLAQAGRLDTDYSKRESSRDRPGSNGAAGIDIGWFEVVRGNRRITLIDLNRWLVAQLEADAPDTRWIREVIYTLDRRTVKRWDRLKKRTTGDLSHTSHTHVSGHRDAENVAKAGLFERFWREVEGGHMGQLEVESQRTDERVGTMIAMLPKVPSTGEDNRFAGALLDVTKRLDDLATSLIILEGKLDVLAAAVAALGGGGVSSPAPGQTWPAVITATGPWPVEVKFAEEES